MFSFKSFGPSFDAVVIGASGGIGNALVQNLVADTSVRRVAAFSRKRPAGLGGKVLWHPIDLHDESSIREAARSIEVHRLSVRLVIVASGMLHGDNGEAPEKTWRALNAEALHASFAVNAVGPVLIAKHFLGLLESDGKSLFAVLAARVGSISDNRAGGWYAYRASKAALNMLIKTLSIELARKRPGAVCVGLHPGTVRTRLSAPFVGDVPSPGLFEPDEAAHRLLRIIDNLGPTDSGNQIAWDGQPIAS